MMGCSTMDDIGGQYNINLKEDCNTEEILDRYIAIDDFVPVYSNDIIVASVDKLVDYKSCVYIFDKIQSIIYAYNLKNKTLSVVLNKRGHAKEEYINICDFTIDKKGDILVYDSDMGKINWYTNKGRFIRTMPVVVGGKSFALAGDGKIAIDYTQMESDVSVVVYLPNGSVSSKIKQSQLYSNFSVQDHNSITWSNGNVIFTRPYDYTIYSGINEDTISLFHFDFGGKNYSFDKFDGISYEEFQKQLMVSAVKKEVLWLSNISVYKNLYFFATDNMSNILLDTSRGNKTYILSNMKLPYDVLFCSPLFVNGKGEIYTSVRCDNVDNALRPLVKFNQEQGKPVPKFLTKALEKQYNNVSFWLLKAQVK